MKKTLIITTVFLLSIINLYSQDIIDPPRLFDKSAQNWVAYTGHSIYLPDKFYTGKDFLLAWNWGSIGEKLDSALKVNYYHGYVYNNNDVIDSAKIIENLPMASNRRDHAILNAFSAYYEPTIIVDTTNNFTPRSGCISITAGETRGKNRWGTQPQRG